MREESRAATQHTQSQVEGRLKERIGELEGEIAEAKKLVRKRQDEVEDLQGKLTEAERATA